MIRILPIILLTGCAGGAIIVDETETSCRVSGSVFSASPGGQTAPMPNTCYQYEHLGENCTVRVWAKDCKEDG